jgi:hypothetical protein
VKHTSSASLKRVVAAISSFRFVPAAAMRSGEGERGPAYVSGCRRGMRACAFAVALSTDAGHSIFCASRDWEIADAHLSPASLQNFLLAEHVVVDTSGLSSRLCHRRQRKAAE